jgi:hypothetical protein
MIDWEKFAERVAPSTVVRGRLGIDRGISEFIFVEFKPMKQWEWIIGKDYDEETREKWQTMPYLSIEVINRQDSRRIANPENCEFFIDNRWQTFEEIMK